MFAHFSGFHTQKRGNEHREYEDAFFPKGKAFTGDSVSFAISDGATESSHSKTWAQILVVTYCKSKEKKLENDFVKLSRENWDGWKQRYLAKREKLGKPIQWFEEDSIAKGAFASFLGLTFLSHDSTWVSIAKGDSCLFQVRKNEIIVSFPLCSPMEFNNTPALVASNLKYDRGEIVTTNGCWKPNDIFLLMTDALACWFLKGYEDGRVPLDELLSLGDETQFFQFIERLRNDKLIKNDDVTLSIIRVLGE